VRYGQHCTTRPASDPVVRRSPSPSARGRTVSTQHTPTASEQITRIGTITDRHEPGYTAVQKAAMGAGDQSPISHAL